MPTFERPVFELIEFNANDIIATSGEPGGGCHPVCPNGVCEPQCMVNR